MKKDNTEQKRTFSRRLRLSMSKMHMNATELSNATGIGKSDISNYMNGKYLPKQDRIYLMATELHVNPAWLWGFLPDSPETETESPSFQQDTVPSEEEEPPETDPQHDEKVRKIRQALGQNIKTFRQLRGMTQYQLAETVGLAPSTIAMYETGSREPDMDTLEAISHAIKVRMMDLIPQGEEEQVQEPEPESAPSGTNVPPDWNSFYIDDSTYEIARGVSLMSKENREKLLSVARIMFMQDFDEEGNKKQ